MKNWLNQDIEVGDYVFYANKDDHRIGRAVQINPVDEKVQVQWLLEPTWFSNTHDWDGSKWVRNPAVVTYRSCTIRKGWIEIDRLFKCESFEPHEYQLTTL